ncbi:hypothetical protein JTB14_019866 [Gonioctena quinquepunctata]|nr:hypothetical protein JTB14_019866 [Gonioctena quinquepunctata]
MKNAGNHTHLKAVLNLSQELIPEKNDQQPTEKQEFNFRENCLFCEKQITEQFLINESKKPHSKQNNVFKIRNPGTENGITKAAKQHDDSWSRKAHNKMMNKYLLDPKEDAISNKERLKYMQEYERWDEVKLLWKKCQNFRRKLLVEDESTNIINILTEWPCYKHPMGSTLIDLDFENISPKATNVFEKLNLIFNIALEVFTIKIKDKHCKAVLGKLQDETVSEDGRTVVTLFLLRGVIVPTSKKVMKTGKRKVLLKFTITDSQDSFMVTGRSIKAFRKKQTKSPDTAFSSCYIR